MTVADVEHLLIAYGDALEATHPIPAETNGTHSILAPILVHAADEGALDADAALDAEVFDFTNERARRPMKVRELILSIAAGLIVLTLVAVGLLRDDDQVDTGSSPDTFIFEGEVVLRREPLVVLAAPPSEPTFDTSELGTRVGYGSFLELSEAEQKAAIDNLIMFLNAPTPGATAEDLSDSLIRKLTILGVEDNPDGVGVAAEAFVDWPESNTRAFHQLSSSGDDGSSSDAIPANPDDPALLRVPATSEEYKEQRDGLSYPVIGPTTIGPSFALFNVRVAQDVSVIQLLVDGEPESWAVPVNGTASFYVEPGPGALLGVVAFDQFGQELNRGDFILPQN